MNSFPASTTTTAASPSRLSHHELDSFPTGSIPHSTPELTSVPSHEVRQRKKSHNSEGSAVSYNEVAENMSTANEGIYRVFSAI